YHLQKRAADSTIYGETTDAGEYKIEIPVENGILEKGGNEINLTTMQGSWIVFDQIRLTGPDSVELEQPPKAFIRDVEATDYEITDEGRHVQPLLVDVEHLQGQPNIQVKVDGENIFSESLEQDRYRFETPMPEVESRTVSRYEVLVDGTVTRKGNVIRRPEELNTPADYVDTMMGVAHSRWMIAPGP